MGHPGSRRFPTGCAILLASLALAACGDEGSTAPGGAKPATSSGYPVTIRNCGRTLTFDRAPSRVFVSYHPIAEILAGLRLADRAIGRGGYEGGLREPPLLREQAAALRAVPVASDNNYPPPKEKLLTLRPDLVLTYGIFDYGGKAEGKPGLATIAELETAGAKSYMATCPDGPEDPGQGYGEDTLDATYRTILDLGTIFDVRPRAEARVAEMKRQIAAVRAKVAGDPLKVLIYSRGTGPIEAVGGTGLISEIVGAAGGENVFAKDPQFFQASLEKVAANPAGAFVIFADYGKETARLDATDEARFLFKTFPNMAASKDKRFAVTGYEFTSPGWRIAQTVEDLARQLHPDLFDAPSRTQQHTDPSSGV